MIYVLGGGFVGGGAPEIQNIKEENVRSFNEIGYINRKSSLFTRLSSSSEEGGWEALRL